MRCLKSLSIALGFVAATVAAPAAATAAPVDTQVTSPPGVAITQTSDEPAATSFAQCPSGRFCVWTNADGTGYFAKFEWGSPDLANPIGGHVFNDEISSVWNRTGYKWCLYEHKDWSPSGRIMGIGDYMGTVGGPRYSFDNLTSSLRACS